MSCAGSGPLPHRRWGDSPCRRSRTMPAPGPACRRPTCSATRCPRPGWRCAPAAPSPRSRPTWRWWSRRATTWRRRVPPPRAGWRRFGPRSPCCLRHSDLCHSDLGIAGKLASLPRGVVRRILRVAQPWWKPVWSVPAAMRAVRATVVVPSLFALTFKGIGDPQMALFATFGGFATLVIAGFSGTRKDKLVAHTGLAVAGSLVLIIGTLVSGTTWLAALVTVPVTFAIFFAGIAGPNAVSGSTAAMFAYVLPVASAGGAATIPSRLEGWWLASAVGTAAVLLLSPRPPGDRLRTAAAALAAELASRLRAAANGEATQPQTMLAAKEELRAAFTAAPFRPTGLATADQALASLVELLKWGAAQVSDAFDGHVDLTRACPADRELLRVAASLLADVQALLSGRAAEPDSRTAAAHAVHAQAIAVVARGAAADALIASRRADPETIAAVRRQWYGAHDQQGKAQAIPNGGGRLSALTSTPRLAGLAQATSAFSRHATVRSVWFTNSLRGAVALAAAVAIADLSSVQHGFWVVLGTLSVLRTSAAATGATAWRALAGTVIGFVVGALLLLAIGTGQTALWVAFPIAVLVAAYAPGTTPFLVGQAAFTVTIVVLFNLLVPVGWKVGLLRVEDVAIGCAVSLVVGVLFWPRGASSVVAEDLADAFRVGAQYLTQAVDWALSELMLPPAAALAAVSASIRLDDAVNPSPSPAPRPGAGGGPGPLAGARRRPPGGGAGGQPGGAVRGRGRS